MPTQPSPDPTWPHHFHFHNHFQTHTCPCPLTGFSRPKHVLTKCPPDPHICPCPHRTISSPTLVSLSPQSQGHSQCPPCSREPPERCPSPTVTDPSSHTSHGYRDSTWRGTVAPTAPLSDPTALPRFFSKIKACWGQEWLGRIRAQLLSQSTQTPPGTGEGDPA